MEFRLNAWKTFTGGLTSEALSCYGHPFPERWDSLEGDYVKSLILSAVGLLALGCASGEKASPVAKADLEGTYVEGCECHSVCPCIWNQDTSKGDCRAIFAYHVDRGAWKGVDLAGQTFGVALTHSGKNIKDALGRFEGVLLLPAGATKAQQDAARALLKEKFGGAFGKLGERVVPMSFEGKDGSYTLKAGDAGMLKMRPIRNAAGAPTAVENAPSPLAPLPKFYLATSDVVAYKGEGVDFSFKDTNAFYGPFEIR
jgi:hypothetical protein